MQGPIGDNEVNAVRTAFTIAGVQKELGDKLITLPWMQDGISDNETTAIAGLQWLTLYDPDGSRRSLEGRNESIGKALNLPWLQDDVTDREADLMIEMGKFSYGDKESYDVIGAVLDMPLMQSADSMDKIVVWALRSLHGQEIISEILSHPRFQGGITEESAPYFVAVVFTTTEVSETVRRGTIRFLLELGNGEVETLSRGTKLTPDMKVSIFRTRTEPHPELIEGVWKAVEFVEKAMQKKLPIGHVLIDLNGATVLENTGGTHHGHYIAFHGRNEHIDYLRKAMLMGLAHEVAHYYWRSGRGKGGGRTPWVNEGMADTLEYMYGIETGLLEGKPEPERGNCKAHDLEMLTKNEHETEAWELDRCPYYLGSSLFLELLEKLGTAEFNKRIRELHRVYEATNEEELVYVDEATNELIVVDRASEAYTHSDIHGVRQVFHDQLDIVERHWSGRMNAPENRP